MKKSNIINIKGPFEAGALRVLRQVPGLAVVPQSTKQPKQQVDAIIRYAGTQARVAIEVKRRANAATAWQLVHYAQANPNTRLLLIAGETTAEAREILSGHGIAAVDAAGNAHIELPGLMFHVEGRRRPAATRPPTRLRGKAGIVAQALLLQPEAPWRVQDLAKEARVSAGLAHRVLARLETEGVVQAEGLGPSRVRRVTNPTALLDLWAEENVERPIRTLGYLLAQTPAQLINQLAGNLERSGIEYALTGAAAASLIAPFITAVPVVEVWVRATAAPEELYRGARADPVAEGQNIVFLQGKDDAPLAFRRQANQLWIANPFRVYADLRHDPRRGREQADHLRPEVIGF